MEEKNLKTSNVDEDVLGLEFSCIAGDCVKWFYNFENYLNVSNKCTSIL